MSILCLYLVTIIDKNFLFHCASIGRTILCVKKILTTQMYLGKITVTEAIRWIDALRGN